MKEYLNFAIEISEYADKIIKKYFTVESESTYKSDNTIVTKADKLINKYLIDKVKEKYPEHSVLGEEETYGKSKYVWVCDPIDGTAMYARHIPVAVFSLALVIDGEPYIGVIRDSFTNNIYTAIKGENAYKNNQVIKVNNLKFDKMKTICHFDIWPYAEYEINDIIKELSKETYMVSIGSVIRASLCVATGEFNSVIFPGTTSKNCDIAAVKVIIESAGGKVTDLFGNEQRYDKNINGAIISNNIVHNELTKLVKKHLKNKKERIYSLKDKKEYLEEVIMLEHNEWAENPNENYGQRIREKCKKVESLLDKKDFCKLILLNEDELIGFISIFPQDCEEEKELSPWYATMYVKEKYRNKGYSKVLNEAILNEAKERGFKELYLKSELINYYEKFGAIYIKNINKTEKLYKIIIN